MTESTPTLTPEGAAALMRTLLPEGKFPGAPPTGPALLARSGGRSSPQGITGPTAHLVSGPGRGAFRYQEAEVVEFCIALYPPRIRKALACLERAEKLRAAAPDLLDEPLVSSHHIGFQSALDVVLDGDDSSRWSAQ